MAIGKVASYLKNVGKSVSYSLVDVTLKDNTEGISEFIETNQDLFKEVYSAAKNYKATLKVAERSIKASKIYVAGAEGWKAIKEDIRTGNFYNKAREEDMNLKSAGDDFADMFSDDFDDDNFNDDSFDDEPESVKDAFSGAMEDATTASCNIMARSTDYLAETSKANTRSIMANASQIANAMAASINSGLGQIHAEISKISQLSPGIVNHMENSKTYYETTTKIFQENNAILKEIVEMQRNLYKNEYTESKYKTSPYDNIVGSSGTPDMKEYAKTIVKNIKNIAGPEAEMLLGDTMGKGSNLLLTAVGAPLKFIPTLLAKTLVPTAVSKILKTFDQSLSTVFSNMIAQFNYAANNDNFDDEDRPLAGVFKMISKALGVEIRKKESINPDNYKKGPVPFDGITRQTIIEVIPGHLRRIESALTGRPERLYNNGRWSSVKEVEKEFKDIKSNAIASGSWEMMDSLRGILNEAREKNTEEYTRLSKELTSMFTKIYNDGGAFRPNDSGFADDKYYEYGFSSPEEFKSVIRAMNVNKPAMKRMAGEMMSSRERAASRLTSIERDSYSPIRELFSGAYKDIDVGKAYDPNDKKGYMKPTDNKGHDTYYYLQNILGELIYMRKNGLGMGGDGEETIARRRIRNNVGDVTSLIPESEDFIKERAKKDKEKQELERRLQFQREKYGTSMNANYIDTASEEERQRLEKDSDKEEAKNKTFISTGIDKYRKKHGLDSDAPFLDQLLQATSIGQKWAVIQGGLMELTKKPADLLVGIISKADERVYDMMFGNENIKNNKGLPIKGMMELMVTKVEESFDKLNYWIDDHVLKPIKNKLGIDSFGDLFKKMADKLGLTEKWANIKNNYINPIKDATKRKLGSVFNYGKDSVSSVYHGAKYMYNKNYGNAKKRAGFEAQASEMGEAYDFEDDSDAMSAEADRLARIDELKDMGAMANGGVVPRTGPYVLSKGEIVIPSYKNKAHLAKQKRNERNVKNAYGRGILGQYAEGTVGKNIGDSQEYVDAILGKGKGKKLGGTFGEIWNTAKSDVTDTASSGLAGGIVGTGVSILTGIAGGPILGAAIGVGSSLIKRSEKLQSMLFGELGEDGERKEGGLVSTKLQKTLTKYIPDMAKGGITGMLAGLITPFGPVGGLIIGSAAGFMKNNDSFQTWLYGDRGEDGNRDGGLISKDFRDGVKKALPRMGVGAAAGALLGPGGFLLNAAMGAGVGMITTTDTFKNIMLGEEDVDGNREGGILGAINEGLVEPLKNKVSEFGEALLTFTREDIIDPLKNFVEPLGQLMKNMVIDIGSGIRDSLNNIFEKTIGMPLGDLVREKLIKPMTSFLGKAFNLIINPAKFLISAPAKILGGIGNKMRSSQIRRGHATNMTAQERIEFRGKHGMKNQVFDQAEEMDSMLAGMDNNALSQLYEASGEFIKGKDFSRDKLTSARKAAGKSVSDFLNKNRREDGTKLYDIFGQKNVKKLDKAISEGNIAKAEDIIAGSRLTPDEKKTLVGIAQKNAADIAKKSEDRGADLHTKDELMSQVEKLTGKKMRGEKDFRYLYENVKTEMKSKNKEDITPIDSANARGLEIVEAIKTSNSLLRHIAKLEPTPEDKKVLGTIPLENNNAAQNRKQKAKAEGINIDKVNANIDAMNAGFGSMTGGGGLSTGISTYQTPGGHTITYLNGEPQDDKESVAGLREIDLNEEREESMAENIKQTSEHTGGLFSHLFGKDAKGEKKETFFDKVKNAVGGGLGKVLKVLGIGGAVAVGGAALGYGSEAVKTELWPVLRDKFFPKIAALVAGTKDPDTGNLNGGLRGLLIGNKNADGTYDGGILAPIRPAITGIANSISKFFGFMMSPGEDGFRHWLTNVALPGAVNTLVRGWGYTLDNIVVPLTSLVVQSLPAIGKGILLGIKELIFHLVPGSKMPGREAVSVDVTKTAEALSKTTISTSKTKSEFGGQFSISSAPKMNTSESVDFGEIISDAIGPKNNSTEGALGAQHRTNELVFDEYGNNITDYERKNTQNSIASQGLNVAGNAFLQGLAGRGSPGMIKWLSGMKLKIPTSIMGGVVQGTKGAVTGGAKVVNGVNNIGQWMGKKGAEVLNGGPVNVVADAAGDTVDNIAGAAAKSADDVVAAAGKNAVKGNRKYYVGEDNIIHLTNSSTTSGAVDDIAGAAAKSADDVVAAAGKNAVKGSTIVSKNGRTIKLTPMGADDAVKGAGGVVDDVMEAAAKGADDVVAAATKSKGLIGTIVSKVTKDDGLIGKIISGIQKIFSGFVNSKCGQLFFKAIGKVANPGKMAALVSTALDKFAGKLGTNIIGKLGAKSIKSIASSVAKLSPLGLLIGTTDFVNGCRNAYTVFGIANGGIGSDGKFDDDAGYKLNMLQSGLAGLINLLTNFLTFGLIPADAIMDIAIDVLLPVFGINCDKLIAARSQTTAILDAWNAQHPDVPFDNLQDFNLRNDLIHKAWTSVKDTVGGAIGNIGNAVTDWWSGTEDENGNKTGGAKAAISAGASKVMKGASDFGRKIIDTGKNIGSAVGSFIFGEKNEDGTKKSEGFFGDPVGTLTKAKSAIDSKLGSILGMVDEDGNPMSLSDGVSRSWSDFTKSAAEGFTGLTNGAKALWNNAGDSVKKIGEEFAKGIDKVNENLGAMLGFVDKDGKPMKLTDGIKQKFDGAMNAVGDWFGGFSGSKSNGRSSGFGSKSFGRGRSDSGYGRSHYGYGHLYQKDPAISNMAYGNGSTIGQAGCGPVAASNLINGLNGYGLDVKTAAKYAKAGGYTGSDGGTNINYFGDVLDRYGYANTKTNNPNQVYNSLKQGKQAVLLGQDNLGPNGPFSSRAHFITAKGLDKNGNVIVDDPDRAQSNIRYNVSDVLSNMSSSVIASPKHRMTSYGRGRSFSNSRVGNFRYGFGPSNVSDLAKKTYNITRLFEGTYTSVVPSDAGAMSVGCLQWNKSRAKDVLNRICNALGESKSRGILGDKLYTDIVDGSSWQKRSASSDEVTRLKKFLDTKESHNVQDSLALENVQGYLDHAAALGLKDEKAMAYLADIENLYGGGGATKFAKLAAAKAGSYGAITLDIMHNVALANSASVYTDRRKRCYEACKNLDGVSTIVGGATGSSSGSSGGTGGLFTALAELGTSMVKKMFGADLFDAIFGSSVEKVDPNAVGLTGDQQQNVLEWMKSIKGKIKYSLTGPQDPDKGSASCASTVGWAYKKAIGGDFVTHPMSASCTEQAINNGGDPRFSTIYKSGIDVNGNGTGGVEENKLQIGDLLYYRRDPYANGRPYKTGHVEMYAGNGERIGHGGGKRGEVPGPTIKSLSSDASNIIMARRYNGFDDTSKEPDYTADIADPSADGSSTGTDTSKSGSSSSSTRKDWNAMFNAPKEAAYQSNNGFSANGGFAAHGVKPDRTGRSESGYGRNNDVANLESVRVSTSGGSYRNPISNISSSYASGSAGGISYVEFLKTIVEVLMTIATNSEALGKILALLSDKYGMELSAEEVKKATSSSSNAKQKLSKLLSETGKSPTGYGSLFQDKGTEYIINSMTALARE